MLPSLASCFYTFHRASFSFLPLFVCPPPLFSFLSLSPPLPPSSSLLPLAFSAVRRRGTLRPFRTGSCGRPPQLVWLPAPPGRPHSLSQPGTCWLSLTLPRLRLSQRLICVVCIVVPVLRSRVLVHLKLLLRKG